MCAVTTEYIKKFKISVSKQCGGDRLNRTVCNTLMQMGFLILPDNLKGPK